MTRRSNGEMNHDWGRAPGSRLVLSGGHVFDARSERFTGPKTIILEADMIAEILDGVPLESNDRRNGERIINIDGMYLLPGLIDSHFHLVSRSEEIADDALIAMGMIEGVVNAKERLEAGVTTVRDAGCRHHGVHQLVRAIDTGLVAGPRVFAAGRNPAGAAGPRNWRNVFVNGVEELRAAVRGELAAGAHWVKFILSHAENPAQWAQVTTYFTEEELRAGVEEAHDAGVRTGVHCEGYEPAAMAVRAGIDALEHAPQVDAATADLMAERGVAYVPTLWAFSADSGIDLERLAPPVADAIERGRIEHRASVERALRAGVLIAAGSDAEGSLPARDVLVQELLALQEAGLTAGQALTAATLNGARVLGEEKRIGSLEPGTAADIVMVDHNPLNDLASLERPLLVIARGKIVADNWTDHATLLSPSLPLAGVAAAASVTSRWGDG